jgi:hypothetical protein
MASEDTYKIGGVELSEVTILEECKTGRFDYNTLVDPKGAKWLFAYPTPLSSIPIFKEAIDRRKKRIAAERKPESNVKLMVRDEYDQTSGPYFPAQIRHKFARAQLSANAEFQHPDYPDEWFPCASMWEEAEDAGLAPVVDELKILRVEVRELKEHAQRIKVATAIAAFWITVMAIWGFKLVQYGR